jgi:guanine deaminase
VETSAGFESPVEFDGRGGGVSAVRGGLVWFLDDPFTTGAHQNALRYVEDGMLICRDGVIAAAGEYREVRRALPQQTRVVDYRGKLIAPGFVDAHVHSVQTPMIAARGRRLAEWLEQEVYPEELRSREPSHARRVAELFCRELLRNGTTTALVNCASSPRSVHALFEASTRRGMRLAAGKVLMDRQAPQPLLDASPEQAYEQSKRLLETWHGVGRCMYAVTPRFAVACTPRMLEVAAALWREHPGTLMQTHLAEDVDSVAQVRRLYPKRKDYVDVYEHHGLLGPGAVFAHAVHVSKRELKRLRKTGSAIAHCPTSNLFLGTGLFSLRRARKRGVRVGLGTDVEAGTSLSLLHTTNEAFKVGQLDQYAMDGPRLLYLATAGGARAMNLEGVIGSLAPGHEADFVILDPAATPLLAARTTDKPIGDVLFALCLLGDDRAVLATYVAGRLTHHRDQRESVAPLGLTADQEAIPC